MPTTDDASAQALDHLRTALLPWPTAVQTGARVTLTIADRVSLSAAPEDVAALADGTADAALLLLAGRLTVAGDERFLLEVGGAATVHGRPLVDPSALDPEAVSRAIADVSTEHLDAVMAGGFRDLVLGEVFRRLPAFLREEKAARVRLAVAFAVLRADGGEDRYVVEIDHGSCTVTPQGEAPVAATIVLTGAQFLRLVLGHLNPVRGVLGGQIQVRGELMKALALNSVMRIPGS